MIDQSSQNKTAWEHKAYQFWVQLISDNYFCR